MSTRIIIIQGDTGIIDGINALRHTFRRASLRDAKDIWDRVRIGPTSVTPETWGTSRRFASASLWSEDISNVWGPSDSEPVLDSFECAACGGRPATWIDADLFLDPEHIEVFGGRLLCRDCWHTPMGELLPIIESRVRPLSKWAILMDREETCLT